MQAGLSSREIKDFGVPTSLNEAEGNIAGGVTRKPPADPARSKNLCMYGISMRENREIPQAARLGWESGRTGKTESKPVVNGPGKSDSRIVPAKSPNATKRPGTLNQGAPYTGTKVETPDTDKEFPSDYRASARPYQAADPAVLFTFPEYAMLL